MAQTTLRLPDELHRELKAQAGRRGMTFNAYVLGVLWAVCEQGRKSRDSGGHIGAGER